MKKLSPYAAKTLDEVCSLRTDNKNTDGAWILTDGCNVTVCKQKAGKSAEQSVTLDRAEFNRLIRWYMREQTTVKRS